MTTRKRETATESRIKQEVPLEKQVYKNLKKHVDNRLDLLKKEMYAAIEESRERAEEKAEELQDSINDAEEALTILDNKLHQMEIQKAKDAFTTVKFKTWQSQQESSWRAAVRNYRDNNKIHNVAALVISEETFMTPVNHGKSWTEEDDTKVDVELHRFLFHIAAIMKRRPSALAFRIVKHLNDMGIGR
jgi:hypothetical protein